MVAVLLSVLLDRGHALAGLDLAQVDADALWGAFGGPAADSLAEQLRLDAVTPCEGCGDGTACGIGPSASSQARGIPGIRFPCDVSGDTSFAWIERCDTCQRFASDSEAADAMVEAGLIEGFAWLAPHGSLAAAPYALSATNPKDTRTGRHR